jgi:copper(I)-binding protein
MLLFLAAFNRWVLLPKLSTTNVIQSFRKSIGCELLIMAAILIVMAVMTTQTMPEKKVVISLDKAPIVKSENLIISQYVMRVSLGNVPTSVVYMTIENSSNQSDKLVSAQCTCAARTSFHRMSMNNNMMIMQDIDNIELPARSKTRLEPMGVHLMLHQTRHPLLNGRSETVILQFEKSDPIVLKVPIYEKIS